MAELDLDAFRDDARTLSLEEPGSSRAYLSARLRVIEALPVVVSELERAEKIEAAAIALMVRLEFEQHYGGQMEDLDAALGRNQ